MSECSRPPADMPADEIIESWLPRAFEAAPRRPPPDSPSVRVTLSGPGGGDWDVCVSDDALIINRREPGAHGRSGPHADPDTWLRQSAADFLALFRDGPDLPALLPPNTDVMDLLCVDESKIDLLAHLDGRIAVEIHGRCRRRWTLDLAFGPSGMRAGRPRATVRADSRTCEELSNGTLAVLPALLAGRLQVEGDRALVMQVVMLVGAAHGSRLL